MEVALGGAIVWVAHVVSSLCAASSREDGWRFCIRHRAAVFGGVRRVGAGRHPAGRSAREVVRV